MRSSDDLRDVLVVFVLLLTAIALGCLLIAGSEDFVLQAGDFHLETWWPGVVLFLMALGASSLLGSHWLRSTLWWLAGVGVLFLVLQPQFALVWLWSPAMKELARAGLDDGGSLVAYQVNPGAIGHYHLLVRREEPFLLRTLRVERVGMATGLVESARIESEGGGNFTVHYATDSNRQSELRVRLPIR